MQFKLGISVFEENRNKKLEELSAWVSCQGGLCKSMKNEHHAETQCSRRTDFTLIIFMIRLFARLNERGYMKIRLFLMMILIFIFSCGYYKEHKRKDGERSCRRMLRELVPVGLLLCQEELNKAKTQEERDMIKNGCILLPVTPEINCN